MGDEAVEVLAFLDHTLILRVVMVLPSTIYSIGVGRMCPAVTVRNWADYSPLLAAGSNTGNILIYNVSTGQHNTL
jgi:hypothetical protein